MPPAGMALQYSSIHSKRFKTWKTLTASVTVYVLLKSITINGGIAIICVCPDLLLYKFGERLKPSKHSNDERVGLVVHWLKKMGKVSEEWKVWLEKGKLWDLNSFAQSACSYNIKDRESKQQNHTHGCNNIIPLVLQNLIKLWKSLSSICGNVRTGD